MTTDAYWNTIRENASISFMNALISSMKSPVVDCLEWKDTLAKTAVVYADALIEELKKKE
jgi:hypothetical protein